MQGVHLAMATCLDVNTPTYEINQWLVLFFYGKKNVRKGGNNVDV